MHIQFAAVLKSRTGEDFVEEIPGKPGVTRPLTLGSACCQVLDIAFQDEAQEGFKPKVRRAELAEKIGEAEKSAAPLDLIDSDREMLKDRIGKRNLPASVTLAAVRLLDADKPDAASPGR